MPTYVDEFLIGVGIDPSKVEKGINTVVDNVRSGLTSAITGVVVPALAGLASGELVQQFSQEIVQVDRLSKSLGMNIEQLSAWRTAAEQAGVEADEVGELFADMNDWMVDSAMNDSGAMNDFIKQGLLPAVTDVNGEMKNTEQYILEMADAFKNMDPAQASGIARQIGLSNLQVAQWMQQGGDALREQLAQAKQLGTFTKEDAQASKEFNASIMTLQHSLQMMLLPVFRAIAPILTKIANGFRDISHHIAVFIPFIAAAGVRIAMMMSGIDKLGGSITKLGVKFKAAWKFMMGPWGAILFALLAIGLVLDDFITWLEGGETKWGKYYEAIFGGAENAKKWLSDLGAKIQEIGYVLENLYGPIMTVVGGFMMFTGVVSIVKNVITAIKALRVAMAAALAFTGPWGMALAALGVILGGLIALNWDDFFANIQGMGERIMQAWEEVKAAFDMSALKERFSSDVSDMGADFVATFEGIQAFIDGFVEYFLGGVATMGATWDAQIQGASATWNAFVDGAMGMWNSFVNAALETWNAFVDGINGGVELIKGAFDTVSSIVSGFLSAIGASSLGQAVSQINSVNTTNIDNSRTYNYGGGGGGTAGYDGAY